VRAEPAAVVSAAHAAAEALARLEAAKIDPGMPLAGYLVPLGRVQNAARWGSNTLAYTGRLAAEAMTLSGPLPEPDAAPDVREKLKAAARQATAAADHAFAAWRQIERDLRAAGADTAGMQMTGRGPLVRLANAASVCVSELEAELTRAAARPVPAALPALAGLEEITEAQALIMVRMGRFCGRLHSGITDAYGQLGREAAARSTRATAPLHQAGANLRRAATITNRAHTILAGTRTRARKTAGVSR
jgi:hypothetical protein